MSRLQVLRVEKVYKGHDRLGQLGGVTVLGKGSSCAMRLVHGTRYLIYAQARGHALTLSMCSRTKPMSQAEEDLRILEPREFRRNFDLAPTPDRDWLKVTLAPDWAFETGRVQRLELRVEPTSSVPRVPIAAWLAAGHVEHAPFDAAARFMVVASAGGATDEKLTVDEQCNRLSSAASRIRHESTEVSAFSVDDKVGAKNLELLADGTGGGFHAASVDVESAIADDVARWQRVVGGLATVELETHGGVEIVGARGLVQRGSRRLGEVHIGSLFDGETITRSLYLDIPEGLEVDDPLVSVRLRYLDPKGTSAQAIEEVELGWSGPP